MKKNILFIITKGSIGGAQKFVVEQIEILEKTANYNLFLATNQEGWLTNKLEGTIQAVFLDTNIEKRKSFSYLIKLHSFIKKNNIQLVICNSANGGLYGRLATIFTNCQSIYVSHGWSSVYNGGRFTWLLNKIEKGLALLGQSVLCVSKVDFEIAKSIIKIPVEKLKLINNSMYPMSFISVNNNTSYKKQILTVARLSPPKRIDLLIEAMVYLPECHLTIVGNGEEFEKLETLIKQLNLQNISMIGEIKGFKDFKRFDIFALISDSEGLPFSAMEALSAGLPLVLSNVGGCSALIEQNGVLVANNKESIYEGINTCILNKVAFAKKSLELFDSQFNLKYTSTKYITYYKEIIHKKNIGITTNHKHRNNLEYHQR